jgi:hypothetical protein
MELFFFNDITSQNKEELFAVFPGKNHCFIVLSTMIKNNEYVVIFQMTYLDCDADPQTDQKYDCKETPAQSNYNLLTDLKMAPQLA